MKTIRKIGIFFLFFSSIFVCGEKINNKAFAQIISDTDGNAVAVWQDLEDSYFIIRASTRPAGGSWSSHSVTISTGNQDCKAPQVACNEAGTVVAVWQEGSGSEIRINGAAMEWTHRDEWTLFPSPLSPAAQASIFPQVGIDAEGSCVVIWENTTAQQIQASLTTLGAPWTSPYNVGESHDTAIVPPALAVNENGTIVVAWQDLQTLYQQSLIKVRMGSTSGTWQDMKTLSPPQLFSYTPSVSLNNSDIALVAWQTDPGDENPLVIQAVHYPVEEEAYTFPVTSGNMVTACTTINNGNKGVVVWQEHDTPNNSSLIRSSLGNWDGTSSHWSGVETVSASTGNFLNPTVSINDNDLLLASWEVSDPDPNTIEGALYSFGETPGWLSPITFSNESGGTQPDISITPDNTAMVIWATDENDPALQCDTYTPADGWSGVIGINE